ncbi:MAG: MBL fold metallo-hydrolase [Planctomycetota bacterium]|jgi:glyoxylase-like metal-dependent hydrolase (beta-lactamase superfamily II)
MNEKIGTDTHVTTSGRLTRADLLTRAGGALLGAAGLTAGCLGGQAPAASAHRWKGRQNSKVKRWDVITIGNLSRNRYWGESDARGVRAAICTCTLIAGDGFRVLVDPSLSDATQMTKELDRRTGVKPRDITAVFVTHEHGDHFAGMAHFPKAHWLAAPAVAEILNKSGKLSHHVEGVTGVLSGAVEAVPTPGHTTTHHSLRFDCDGLSIIVAGDAVPTRDFFRDRRGYFNAVDFEQSARTMDRLATMADVIVPGHDNYFLPECVVSNTRA